jgi:hypothetical protein
MDLDKPKGPVDPSTPPLAIETMLGYAGSIGTALWSVVLMPILMYLGEDLCNALK